MRSVYIGRNHNVYNMREYTHSSTFIYIPKSKWIHMRSCLLLSNTLNKRQDYIYTDVYRFDVSVCVYIRFGTEPTIL